MRHNLLVTLNLHFPEPEATRVQLTAQRQWAANMAYGPMVKFLPQLAQRKHGFDVLFEALDNGDRPLKAYLGVVLFTPPDEAVAAAERLGPPVMVKAQVHTGGRGKAGGVKFAADIDAVREHAGNIFGLDIKGHIVERIWIEKASDIDEEYYASFTLDRGAKQHLLMLSAEGGVEIEEYRTKIQERGLPEEAVKEAERELDRLSKMHPSSAEYTVSSTYLDWLTDLPWQESTKDNLDMVISAGWVKKQVVCQGVQSTKAPAACK